MSNYEDHWMDQEQAEPRTKRIAARSTAEIIAAYQDGASMTDAEVEQVYHALVRLENAVLEVGNDVSLVVPWVAPKRQSFEGFMKHRAEKRREAIQRQRTEFEAKIEAEKARITAINKRLNPEMFRDPNEGWGPWLSRKDAPFPFQEWKPFENADYVEVSNYNRIKKGRASDFWWGWTREDSEENTIISRARKWVGPGDPPK